MWFHKLVIETVTVLWVSKNAYTFGHGGNITAYRAFRHLDKR